MENDFGQYFNLKNEKFIYCREFLKIVQFHIFDWKKGILTQNFVKKLYCEVGIYIMKQTNFHKISLKETREKWARVFFVCMFVTSYNFEMTMHACTSMAFWHHLVHLRGRRIMLIFKLLSWTLRHIFGDENLEKGILTLWIGCIASCIWVMMATKIWSLFAVFSRCCFLLFSIFEAPFCALRELVRWLNL